MRNAPASPRSSTRPGGCHQVGGGLSWAQRGQRGGLGVHACACVCGCMRACACLRVRAGACTWRVVQARTRVDERPCRCTCMHPVPTRARTVCTCHPVCPRVCPWAPAAPRHRWVPPAPRCQRGLPSPWGGGGSAVRASSCLLPWKPSAPRAREPRGHAGGGAAGGAGLPQAARALARVRLRGTAMAPWGWAWLRGDIVALWGWSQLHGDSHGSMGTSRLCVDGRGSVGMAAGPCGQSRLRGMVTAPPG